ncbi:membrane protein [Streptomyces noursei ATCC 11455]|nr:membrane protein [Streptomyces noursei ATCC 11455]
MGKVGLIPVLQFLRDVAFLSGVCFSGAFLSRVHLPDSGWIGVVLSGAIFLRISVGRAGRDQRRDERCRAVKNAAERCGTPPGGAE